MSTINVLEMCWIHHSHDQKKNVWHNDFTTQTTHQCDMPSFHALSLSLSLPLSISVSLPVCPSCPPLTASNHFQYIVAHSTALFADIILHRGSWEFSLEEGFIDTEERERQRKRERYTTSNSAYTASPHHQHFRTWTHTCTSTEACHMYMHAYKIIKLGSEFYNSTGPHSKLTYTLTHTLQCSWVPNSATLQVLILNSHIHTSHITMQLNSKLGNSAGPHSKLTYIHTHTS